jgi:glycosyltransferase involved in cell wall biosynthesis
MNPLVSIIIPVFNTEKFILKTIQSCLAQTYIDFEVIVVDDGSTDNCMKIINSIKDDRIKYHYTANSGVSAARNFGLSLAIGSYIAFLDADDLWNKEKLKVQIEKMISEGALWSITDCDTIDSSDKIIERNISEPPRSNNHLEELLTWSSPSFVAMSGLVICSSLKDKIKFNESISSPADRDFMIKLSRYSNALYIDQSLWKYRILEDSMSRKKLDKIANDMKTMYSDYTDDFFLTKEIKYRDLKKINFILYRTYLKELKFFSGLLSFGKYFFYYVMSQQKNTKNKKN